MSGDTLIVGANEDVNADTGLESGSAYIFKQVSGSIQEICDDLIDNDGDLDIDLIDINYSGLDFCEFSNLKDV